MSIVASNQDRLERLEQLDAVAAREWATYGERLRDLTGDEYVAAEAQAWEELQLALGQLREEREELAAEPTS
jgi:hypothetical protein